jgi:hypothetical protein
MGVSQMDKSVASGAGALKDPGSFVLQADALLACAHVVRACAIQRVLEMRLTGMQSCNTLPSDGHIYTTLTGAGRGTSRRPPGGGRAPRCGYPAFRSAGSEGSGVSGCSSGGCRTMIPGCPRPRSIKSMRAIRFWICSAEASLSSLSLSSSSSGGSTSLLPPVVRYARSVYPTLPCSWSTRFWDACLPGQGPGCEGYAIAAPPALRNYLNRKTMRACYKHGR